MSTQQGAAKRTRAQREADWEEANRQEGRVQVRTHLAHPMLVVYLRHGDQHFQRARGDKEQAWDNLMAEAIAGPLGDYDGTVALLQFGTGKHREFVIMIFMDGIWFDLAQFPAWALADRITDILEHIPEEFKNY